MNEQFTNSWVFWHVTMKQVFKQQCNYCNLALYSSKEIDDRERHKECKPKLNKKNDPPSQGQN